MSLILISLSVFIVIIHCQSQGYLKKDNWNLNLKDLTSVKSYYHLTWIAAPDMGYFFLSNVQLEINVQRENLIEKK